MKCLRCGNEYDDPYPPVTNPGGRNTDIATEEWCASCNARAMGAVYRGSSAYWIPMQRPPWQGERKEDIRGG